MNRKYLALVSVVATFSLLAFVFSGWFKPMSAHAAQQIGQSHNYYSAVPKASSAFLAEVKSRIPEFGSTVLLLVRTIVLEPNTKSTFKQPVVAYDCPPRQLWLINRALLI